MRPGRAADHSPPSSVKLICRKQEVDSRPLKVTEKKNIYIYIYIYIQLTKIHNYVEISITVTKKLFNFQNLSQALIQYSHP